MSSTRGFLQTSVGKKIIMAVTGFVLVGFIFGHMAGNLQIFSGADKMNKYAEFLQSLGTGLWVVRLFLLMCLAAHVKTAVQLKLENAKARPIKYQVQATNRASLPSMIMIPSGMVILLFIIIHLAHYTLVVLDPELASLKADHKVYEMVILGFQNIGFSIFYIFAMALLSLHLSHAIFSMIQTVGLNNTEYDSKIKLVSNLLAVVAFVGYSSIPLSIMTGIVK